MLRPASLQGRLLLLVLATSLAVWLATAALTWRDARHELDELLDGHLAQAAALLVAQQARAHDDDERVDAPVLHRYAPRVVFQVFHEGRLSLRSANAPAEPMIAAAPGQTVQGFHTVQRDGQPWRVFATRGAEHDVQVFVGEQQRARTAILRSVLRSTVSSIALALPLLAIAGWWAVRRGVQPLRALGSAIAARQAGELQPVPMPEAPAEMRPMVDALNALFERIAGLIERERRFTGDAAHELRTPIAAVRAQAQVALAATEDGQRRHALQATLAGCDRATRLVEQLLTLSRLESGEAALRAPVEIGAVVQGVAAELAPASLQKRQQLEVEAEAGCTVAGDATLLAVLVRNLVDNAIRYSPQGGPIAVRVQSAADATILEVEDGGPGLAADDLARLGQRFFRMPGTEEPGSGLGWSIVQRIAQAHGARLEATRSPRLGGLLARATFPSAGNAAMRK